MVLPNFQFPREFYSCAMVLKNVFIKAFWIMSFEWFKYFFLKKKKQEDFIIGFLFSNFILRKRKTFDTS